MATAIVAPVRTRAWDEYVVYMGRWSAPGSLESECLVHTQVRRLSDAIQRACAWLDRWPEGYVPHVEVWLEGRVCVFVDGPGVSESAALHRSFLEYGGPRAPGRYRWREEDATWRLAA